MISLRTDPEIEFALHVLGATSGTRSQVVREAILTAAALKRERNEWHPTQRAEVHEDIAQLHARIGETLARLEAGQ